MLHCAYRTQLYCVTSTNKISATLHYLRGWPRISSGVFRRSFGTSDAETKQKLQKDDIFWLASQSKDITTTAVMMLWEEGKF
jgi:CubicO group peptidase (beta-lactamase class C family)